MGSRNNTKTIMSLTRNYQFNNNLQYTNYFYFFLRKAITLGIFQK